MTHPTARLVCLLALAVVIPFQALLVLVLLTALLLTERGLRSPLALREALQAVWRMRWLLLAITVLYVGFTPGTPVFSGLDHPSWAGLTEGARRALILAAMLLAVHTLIRALPAPRLAAALVQVLAPLQALGVSTRPFALRMAMALDAIASVEHMAREQRQNTAQGSPLDRAAGLIGRVEAAAADRAAVVAELPDIGRPPAWVWLLAAAIAAAGWVLAGAVS